MRLFVCTWLCQDNQAFYAQRIADLIASSSGTLRAIPNGSAHITHAFLGRADDRVLAEVVAVVRDVAPRHVPIAIRLGPPSILYARAEARLVYTPIVDGVEALAHLRSTVVGELQRRLPDVEVSSSHSPHVTLARFRKHTRRGSARPVSDALELAGSEEREDQIAAMQVVSSELTAAAPRYVTLFRVSLDRQG